MASYRGSAGSNWCSICGSNWNQGHICKPSILRAIDAADSRAGDNELAPYEQEPFHWTEGRRLGEGFEMLSEVGDIDDVPCLWPIVVFGHLLGGTYIGVVYDGMRGWIAYAVTATPFNKHIRYSGASVRDIRLQ